MQLLCSAGFDLEIELPYKHIQDFCVTHLTPISPAFADQICHEAKRFVNDSFKLPLCI